MAKYIGETNENVTNGVDYFINTQDMAGRVYKPGGNEWEMDQRIAVWVGSWQNNFYKVYNSAGNVLGDWEIHGEYSHYSQRIRNVLDKQLSIV